MFKVNDEVWTPAGGDGIITSISDNFTDYPIMVTCCATGLIRSFSADGREYLNDLNPTLFFRGTTIKPAPEPMREYIPVAGETCYMFLLTQKDCYWEEAKIYYIDDEFFVARQGNYKPEVFVRDKYGFQKDLTYWNNLPIEKGDNANV